MRRLPMPLMGVVFNVSVTNTAPNTEVWPRSIVGANPFGVAIVR